MGQCCIPSCRTAYTSMQEHRGPLSLCQIGVWPSQPLRGVTKGNKFCTCTQCNPSQEMLPLSDVKMLPLRHPLIHSIAYSSRNSFFCRFPVRTMLSENIENSWIIYIRRRMGSWIIYIRRTDGLVDNLY